MLSSGKLSKKILIILVDFANGGIESFLWNFLSHIDRRKLKIDIAFNRQYGHDTFLEKISPYTNRFYCYGGPLCYSPFFYLPRLFWLMKKAGPYDVIYANAGLLNGFVVFFGYILHIPKRISHLHTQEQPNGIIQYLKKRICAFLIRLFATEHLAPSEMILSDFNPPLVPSKIVLNGIDVSSFEFCPPLREKARTRLAAKNKLLIGHVGRFDKVKNHTFLLQIFSQLHKRHNQSLLLLIGAGKELPTIRQQVKKLQLEKDVIILTKVEDVAPYYQAMDAFIFPSIKEGFGIAVIEAQCAGLPCFISDGVPPEAIVCNTLQVPLAKSTEEWAEIILEKMQDFQRQDCSEYIKRAGYAIETTARSIEETCFK